MIDSRLSRGGGARRPAAASLARALAAAAALCASLLLVPGCARKPALRRVVLKAVRFDPPLLRAAVGDTIEWANEDLVPHTVTARGGGGWDSGELPPDRSWRRVLTPADRGTLPYVCRLHGGMNGRLEVR